ncbi:unnamed protein product, partial [Notodromas monacha]
MTHAQNAGKKTGIVSTTRITHATPAAAFGRSPDRNWEADSDIPPAKRACPDLARQLIENDPGKRLNVVFGGGKRNFQPRNSASGKGRRNDARDLIQEWLHNAVLSNVSARYVENKYQLKDAIASAPDRVLGLFSENHMEFESEKKKPVSGEPTLAEMTEAAIELLQNPNGFVLLVEGGRIDHALHCTNAKRAILETLALEKAINTALLSTNPVDTLILVGADHSHVMTINGYPKRGNPIL